MGKKRSRATAAADVASDEAPAAASIGPIAAAKKKLKMKEAKLQAERAAAAASKPSDAQPVGATGDGKKKKKKKSKSKSSASTGAAVASDPEAAGKMSKQVSAIDDLFATLKTSKKEQALADEKKKKDEIKAAKRAQQEKQELQAHIKKLEAQNTNSIGQVGVNPDPRPVRYDEDGLPIYTEESLHIGKGGDTADCPFDCWCCF